MPTEGRPQVGRLVLGLGNAGRGDDGAGRAVIDELRSRRLGEVSLATLDGQLTDLLRSLASAERVTVVDASRSGAPAGTIARFDAVQRSLPCLGGRASTHGLGLNEAIEFARVLDRLPSELQVCAIEGRDFSHGAELSPEVRAAVERLASELADELSGEVEG